jgi:hypothetical protein
MGYWVFMPMTVLQTPQSYVLCSLNTTYIKQNSQYYYGGCIMSDKVVFVKESGNRNRGENVFEINQTRVRMKEKQKGTLSITFESPDKGDIDAAMAFFESMTDMEPLTMDIADTGEIRAYFKGTAPFSQMEEEGMTVYTYGVTIQELQE